MSATLENLEKQKLIELVQKYEAQIANNEKKISELQQALKNKLDQLKGNSRRRLQVQNNTKLR
jgi:hypothetical protein